MAKPETSVAKNLFFLFFSFPLIPSNQTDTSEKTKKKAHVEEDGPRSGFSLRGWNENLPKKSATQESEFLGQLLMNIVIKNMAMLTTTNVGTIHGNHLLNGLNSLHKCCCCRGGAEAAASPIGDGTAVWTTLSRRRGCILISISDVGGSKPIFTAQIRISTSTWEPPFPIGILERELGFWGRLQNC